MTRVAIGHVIAHVRIADVETVTGVTVTIVVEEIAMTVVVDVELIGMRAHARKTVVEVQHVEKTKMRTTNARRTVVAVLLPKRKIAMIEQKAQPLVRSQGAQHQRRKQTAQLLVRSRGAQHPRRKQKA